MKNKYSPVSDSDESFKTLIDEKSDIHSSEGTPPPYSAPNKFIDLEMADGSAQHSAQESTNNAGSDSTYSMWVSANIFLFFASLVYVIPVRTETFWGLSVTCPVSIVVFLYSISQIPKEWFKQTGRVLSYLFTQICSVLSNMCVAVICTASLNAPCYSVYYFVKKVIGFEKMDKGFFYFVCIVNVAVFVLFWSTDTRQLRIFIAASGNFMGNMVNDLENGIRNAANYVRPTDPENEAPQNEEIELQPFAGQSAEV
ncbi:uncharacterized protein SOCG_00295 [Schizosaccharomyces octosporus yFS286]|uniref:Uncharacterized protein n=1 Tax=Schizosaccharomyces octosporus (strain yFS286) TaxID=483514 RepID=S9PX17_SCHOY|nr:uncharacterized protein SOCG_00295 [Schizosaccharomyces octosporus yFS286]EPX72532.1 hypothetical protein SOCG_00295 [Schizosaccharomyces octosporus yFS286]